MTISKEECFKILDKHVKADASSFWTEALGKKTDLCRFTTSFQFYNFEDKLKQYYFTSLNVRFGNALEEIVHLFLKNNGVDFMDRRHSVEGHDCDQIFCYENKVVLIEQKIRDDHDSSKKVGQLENFQNKKNILMQEYDEVYCAFWFIDNCLKKNFSYYNKYLTEPFELCYGEEIEDFLKLIFNDERAKGFVSWLSEVLDEYRNSFISMNIFDNVYIDYTQFTPKALFMLLNEKKYHNEIAQYFFKGSIPYEDILNDYRKKRSTEYTKKLILLLEEKING